MPRARAGTGTVDADHWGPPRRSEADKSGEKKGACMLAVLTLRALHFASQPFLFASGGSDKDNRKHIAAPQRFNSFQSAGFIGQVRA